MRTNQDTQPHPSPADLVMARADGLSDTLRTAAALVGNSRRVELSGLDDQVRELCALALTLPREHAAMLRARLIGLVTHADCLLALLRAAAP